MTNAAGCAVGFRPSAGLAGWAAAVSVIRLVTLAQSWLAESGGITVVAFTLASGLFRRAAQA